MLSGHLTDLLDNGIRPDEIMILSANDPDEDPVIARLDASIRPLVKNLTPRTVSQPHPNRIGAARTALFKGLEAPFVCITSLADLDESATPSGIAELYVAMTRARSGLWLGLSESTRRPIAQITNEATEDEAG